jgi:hypothetical protein
MLGFGLDDDTWLDVGLQIGSESSIGLKATVPPTNLLVVKMPW